MNGYDNTGYSHDYQPWLKLNKQQMADPFGWLQSQNVNVRALLKQMKLDDRWIDNILRGNPPREDMKQHYDKDRLSVGQKAIQFFQKQQLLHGLNEGRKVKLNEQQLRQVIKEAISEIGNTPAGQWMLGRLAGRQQNRAQGKEPGWNTRYGKIKNTTTDAEQYAKQQQQSPYDTYSFAQGRDLENDDWARNADDSLNQDQAWGDVQGYGSAMSDMIRYHAKQNGNRISESKLKSIISKAVNESLHGGDEYMPQADEFYVCSETDYNSGSVDAWIGDKEDAEYCEQSSEGSAIGPFKTYGEAVHYANTNGIEIRDPYERSHNPEDDSDYYHHKLSKSEMQGDEISRLYNNYSMTGQLPSDEDVKRVEKISESKLHKIISESIKKVLKEHELSDREKDIMRGHWSDIENRRMPKQKYPFNSQPSKHQSYANQYTQMNEEDNQADIDLHRMARKVIDNHQKSYNDAIREITEYDSDFKSWWDMSDIDDESQAKQIWQCAAHRLLSSEQISYDRYAYAMKTAHIGNF